jgi:hypothetical protein
VVAAPHRNGCGISPGMALCEAVLVNAKRLIRRARNVRTRQRSTPHIGAPLHAQSALCPNFHLQRKVELSQVTWAAVPVRLDPVEGKVVGQEWALVRRDRAALPAAAPVAVVAEEWLGRASKGPVVLNSERR